MKIILINFSGNVGKSTLATNLFASRMNNPERFQVESLNTGGGPEALKVKGSRYGQLVQSVMKADEAIVDVGASNVEDFLELMRQYEGSHEEFDYFIVPAVKEKKQQMDTINTLNVLAEIGIPSEKIRVVFNKLARDETVKEEFAPLIGYATSSNFKYVPDALVYENEIFELLGGAGKSLQEVMTDPVDYRAKLRETKDEAERDLCVRMVGMKRLGATATKNLDSTYEALFA
jgi:MinD-like ATPase involved in chromosome partitioning or flagellar assembly